MNTLVVIQLDPLIPMASRLSVIGTVFKSASDNALQKAMSSFKRVTKHLV